MVCFAVGTFYENSLTCPFLWEGNNMKRIVVHQWRDWVLEHIGDDKYELIQKKDLSTHTIMAKNAMDAENQSRQIINKSKKETI